MSASQSSQVVGLHVCELLAGVLTSMSIFCWGGCRKKLHFRLQAQEKSAILGINRPWPYLYLKANDQTFLYTSVTIIVLVTAGL